MSQSPTPLETAHGYSPPTATQFGVFLTNKVGKMLDLVDSFDGTPCQICALSVHESTDHAVVRVVTNNAAKAMAILREQNLPFTQKQVLIIELQPAQTLSNLCMCLLGAELSIQFAYPLMRKADDHPAIALAVDDLTLAGQILRRKEFKLLGEADLAAHP
jgi:hypothetical protein